MKKNLYPRQTASVKALYAALRKSTDAVPYADLFTSFGKALVAAKICNDGILSGKRVLQIVPTEELVKQNFTELMEYVDDASGLGRCVGGRTKVYQINRQCVVAMAKSFVNRAHASGKWDLVVIDECFTGETLIKTTKGDKRIDEIRCGDVVYNAIGTGTVKALSASYNSTIYLVKLSNGKEIKVTHSHPIFTQYGWVKAGQLESRHVVFGIQDLRKLREKNNAVEKNGERKKIKRQAVQASRMGSIHSLYGNDSVLLNQLLEAERTQFKNSWCNRKNGSYFKTNRSQTNTSRWQRERTDRTTKDNAGNIRGWMDSRVSNKDKCRTQQWRISELLQSRYWESVFKNGHRIRRGVSQWKKKTVRQQERSFFSFTRVESVSVEKQGCLTPVFNLQITGHPSYFAGGILVHNCDLFSPKPGTTYQKIAAAILKNNPKCRFIGFTGSPYRQDLGLLHETGGRYAPFFTGCCFESDIKEAIAAGDLSPPKNISGHLHIDMEGLPVAGKDYDTNIMGARFEKILPHAVADMKAKYAAYGIKTSLIFASTVENAKHILAEWGDVYTMRLVVSDKNIMSDSQRAENLHWLENGEGERHIVNVGILTTGYNFPALQCVTFFRAILFPRLYIQIAGRVIRKHESKEWGYMLDYGTNIDRHGPIDNINIKAPKGSGDGEAPYRLCQECGTKNAVQAKSCKLCGTVFPPPEIGNYGMRSTAAPIDGELVHDISIVKFMIGGTFHGESNKPAITLQYYDNNNTIVFNETLRFDDTEKGQHLHAQARLLQLLKDKNVYFNTLMEMQGGVSVSNVSLIMEEWENYLVDVRQITVTKVDKYYKITEIKHEQNN